MKSKSLLLIGAIALSVSSYTIGQITPQQAVRQMMRGINLGNTLDAPNDSAWRTGQGHVTASLFDHYKNAGFTSIRIPITWDTHTSKTFPYKIDSAWLSEVEQIVDWGLSRGLFIIINAHHEAWLKTDTAYARATIRARFDSIWSQVSSRLQNKSDHLLFEILNEPYPLSRTNVDDLNKRILSILRKTNPTRLVVFSGNEYSNSTELLAAAIPNVTDHYLIGYYHSYDPWNFAGLAQGTYGIADVAATKSKFSSVVGWSNTNGIPVILDEFGAVIGCDYNSRMFYYATVVEQAMENGVAFNVWDDGGSFNTYNRKDSTWDDSKDVIINTYKESPTNLNASVKNNSVVTLSWTNRTILNDSIYVDRRTKDSIFMPVAKIPNDSVRFIDTLKKANTYYYRLRSWIKDSIQLYSYPIKVTILGQRAPFFDTAVSIPGVIEAENYDLGGPGIGYYNTATSNQGGAYRNDNIGIENRTTGGYQLDYINTGEWLDYTVNVKEAQQYRIDTYTASLNGGGTFTLNIGDSITKPNPVTKTNSWQTLSVESAYLRLKAGIQIFRFTVTNGAAPYNIDKFVFVADSTNQEPSRITEVKNSGVISIYPNPASDYVTLKGADLSTPSKIDIYDIPGKKMKSVMVYSADQHISTDDLEKGVYLFIISQKKSSVIQKVIIR